MQTNVHIYICTNNSHSSPYHTYYQISCLTFFHCPLSSLRFLLFIIPLYMMLIYIFVHYCCYFNGLCSKVIQSKIFSSAKQAAHTAYGVKLYMHFGFTVFYMSINQLAIIISLFSFNCKSVVVIHVRHLFHSTPTSVRKPEREAAERKTQYNPVQ
jgi:hypothetical protein